MAIESAEYAAKFIHEFLSESRADLKEYEDFINQKYFNYLENHHYYYAREKQWQSTFWEKMYLKTLEALEWDFSVNPAPLAVE